MRLGTERLEGMHVVELRLFVTEKECTTCGVVKPLEDFHRRSCEADGRADRCKPCANEGRRKYRDKLLAYNKRWYEENKEAYLARRAERRVPETSRRQWIWHRYRLTEEVFDAMLVSQGGRCAICQGDNGGEVLHVDHDHASGKVRGLLCRKCNAAIGLVADDPGVLYAAIGYLVEHGAGDPFGEFVWDDDEARIIEVA